jgi:superfamily I DNA and RNA helicase
VCSSDLSLKLEAFTVEIQKKSEAVMHEQSVCQQWASRYSEVVEQVTKLQGKIKVFENAEVDWNEILTKHEQKTITLNKKVAELEAVAGVTPRLVSGVSGQGVTELLRAAYRQVRIRRGDLEEEIADDEDHVDETPGGWTP